MELRNTERELILDALRLIGEHGRDAADFITAALRNGQLDRDLFGEAQAQIEDIEA